MLAIIWRLFLETEDFLAAGIGGYTITVRVRLLDTQNRAAKVRSSLNSALGTEFTESPLEHATVSVLLPQPGASSAPLWQDSPSFMLGWYSGTDWWKKNGVGSKNTYYLTHVISSYKGPSVRETQGLALNISNIQLFLTLCYKALSGPWIPEANSHVLSVFPSLWREP